MMKIHLSKFNVSLLSDERSGVPSLREIRIISEENKVIGYVKIDERMYNTLTIIDGNGITGSGGTIENPNTLINYIRDKFRYFKKSNPSYGDYEDGFDKTYGYLGSIALYAEDFLTYLKSENRDILISDILNNEHN